MIIKVDPKKHSQAEILAKPKSAGLSIEGSVIKWFVMQHSEEIRRIHVQRSS